MNEQLQDLYAFIDAHVSDMIELETLLTAHPAVSPNSGGEGELAKCTALEAWLKAHGITKLERFDAPDPRAKGGVRPNLVAAIDGAADDRTVWIMAHMDVVPEGERALWQSDPWTVIERGGKLYGRGVEDNQQGLVSGVFAALACVKSGRTPPHTVKLLFVSDEEEGSAFGIAYLLKHHSLFRPNDMIIIPDGGASDGSTIEVAEKNILWMEIAVHGRQAHGSRPDEGINACLAGSELALLLHGMESHFNRRDELFEPPYSTFQPTRREKNVPNINTIPAEDVFCMDCRILPCYSLDDVRAETAQRVSQIEQKYGVTVDITEHQAMESPATPADAPVVHALQSAVRSVYGIEAKPVGIGGGTVGAYLRAAGFQAAVWARMDETAHQPNEYTKLENLTGDAKVFAAVMMQN